MKTANIVIVLSVIIGILALATAGAGAGFFYPDDGSPYTFKTLRGNTVTMYGQGLYKNDILFTAAGFQGQDLVTIFIGIPLLGLITFLYARRSTRAQFLLTGILGYFLYVYASMALNAAYNNFFLVYVVLFAFSLYAFIVSFSTVDLHVLSPQVISKMPRRAAAAFMFAGGFVTLFVWLLPLISSLIAGEAPELLGSYTTMVTDALDLAVITPAAFISGALILRGRALGYQILFPLLGKVLRVIPD